MLGTLICEGGDNEFELVLKQLEISSGSFFAYLVACLSESQLKCENTDMMHTFFYCLRISLALLRGG